MPRAARPPESTSSVVIVLANIPGYLKCTPVAMAISLIRWVLAARNANVL
jgi:hypothetical protein